jgi:hypothetical protein
LTAGSTSGRFSSRGGDQQIGKTPSCRTRLDTHDATAMAVGMKPTSPGWRPSQPSVVNGFPVVVVDLRTTGEPPVMVE